MLLGPQHFQLQDRYHEENALELVRADSTFGYGYVELELDGDGIQNGQVKLRSVAGVLPTGQPFHMPDREDLPAPRQVEGQFPLDQDRVQVYLGVRTRVEGQAQVSSDAGDEVRYVEAPVRAVDETSGEHGRAIRVSQPAFRILFPNEHLGDHDILPLAEIVRSPEGGYTYDEAFVPPCMSIRASETVVKALRRVLELLVARSTELGERRRQSGKGVAEFGRDDVASFWLMGTVNAYIPVVSHLLRVQETSAESAYLVLAQMAGALSTMSDQNPRDIAPYDHDNAGAAFTDLAERIPSLLGTVTPKGFTRLDVTRRDEFVHTATMGDERVVQPQVALYLGIRSEMPVQDLQGQAPTKIKVASADKIDLLVASALPGLTMNLVQTLPSSLPVQAGYVYFQLDKAGDVWDWIVESKSLAVYAPPDLPGVQVEVVAV